MPEPLSPADLCSVQEEIYQSVRSGRKRLLTANRVRKWRAAPVSANAASSVASVAPSAAPCPRAPGAPSVAFWDFVAGVAYCHAHGVRLEAADLRQQDPPEGAQSGVNTAKPGIK